MRNNEHRFYRYFYTLKIKLTANKGTQDTNALFISGRVTQKMSVLGGYIRYWELSVSGGVTSFAEILIIAVVG